MEQREWAAENLGNLSGQENPLALGEIVMKIRPIVIGMAAWLLLPLAGANARAVFDPGLNQAGAGANLERGAAPTAENFGRQENQGAQNPTPARCDDGTHTDRGGRGGRGGRCDRSPSKPH